MRVLLICAFWLVANPALADVDWHMCQPFEQRINCIVDGDTLWVAGEKMRLAGVDTPEVEGHCSLERRLAEQASRLHLSLIRSGIISITREGQDRYVRTSTFTDDAEAKRRTVDLVITQYDVLRKHIDALPEQI